MRHDTDTVVVGVMTHLSLANQYGLRMGVVVIVSTLTGLGVTVISLHLLRDRTNTGSSSSPPAKEPHA